MNARRSFTAVGIGLLLAGGAGAAQPAYTVTPYRPPEGLKLEVTGIAQLPDGRVALALRKGEVWLMERPDADPGDPQAVGYRRIASGLHEPIGLLWHGGALHTVQRAELTRLRDRNGDGSIDDYETVAQGWGVSGAYHEYGYGPVVDGAGNFWLTLNSTMGAAAKMPGHRPPDNPWRGWALRISPAGTMEPVSAGFRSPSGLGTNAAGDVFATDQQGNFWGTNPVLHVRPGAFFGHKASIADTRRADAKVGDPGVLEDGLTVAEVAKRNPRYTLPAVWLPYPKVGQSATGLACDLSGGKFGPFAGQLFVGEFTLSRVTRVFLERVDGEYQGAAFRFVDGLQSGPVSMGFLADGALLVGETNRGWNSAGTRSYGLERIRWTGVVPFEVRTMRAQPDGFVLEFTAPVDPATAMNPASYEGSSYTYIYQQKYGSPEVETQPVTVTKIMVLPDRKTVRLVCAGLRERYVHELSVAGVRSAGGEPVANPVAYYTLNRIPAR
jgi:glucose/arabinose dehydrogenase